MKRHLAFLLLSLVACSPSGALTDHAGCKVPVAFDQHARDVLEVLKEAQVARTYDFVGVERGQYTYRFPGKSFSNGQTLVVSMKASPEDDGYTQEATSNRSLKRYVNKQTGGVWQESQSRSGLTLSHSCL